MSETKAPDLTGKPPDRRKLVAVVYADMVGYSRLIGLDDAGTLQRLRALRSSVIDPAIDEHGGRIVQTGGDSLLIAFESIDGAVRCAVQVQQQVPVHDGEHPPDRAIRFRIGINIGDAIADGTDLHGDAVNVAARLQAECPPGGICVSRSVHDHVHGRLGLEFGELGPLRLKNIARPVEGFVLRPVGIVGTWQSVERTLMDGTGATLPLPGKPSIAVLAFTNMSGDPEQEYFSDGISEDIITELSRSRSLFVIARNSSFTYKGRAVDIKQVGRELGVRYVLEGSVRRSSGQVRIVAQLIEAGTGNHIWAERYDRAAAEVFLVQDEITGAVTHAIEPAISYAERQRAMRGSSENLGAWEAYQRGMWHLGRGDAASIKRSTGLFERAIKLDPLFAAPHALLAFACGNGVVFGDRRAFRRRLATAKAKAQRAVTLDPDNSTALAVLADLDCCDALYAKALDQADHALSINPNDVVAHFAKGRALAFSGKPEEAQVPLLVALRLSPRDPFNAPVLLILATCRYFSREYADAAAVAQRAIREHPEHPSLHRWLAAALGQLGRVDEARDALHHAMTIAPAAFDFFVRSRAPWFRPQDHEHMLDGLRKAGWQG